MFGQEILQPATAEPSEEGGQVFEEDRPRRAVVDFEPVDVRPGTLAHEPARDERALPDPRDAGHDQQGGRRDGPGIEFHELLGAAEDATEPPQRVAPEERRDASGADAVELREVEPAAPHEGDAAVMLTYAGKISGISATRIRVRARPGARTSTMSECNPDRSF